MITVLKSTLNCCNPLIALYSSSHKTTPSTLSSNMSPNRNPNHFSSKPNPSAPFPPSPNPQATNCTLPSSNYTPNRPNNCLTSSHNISRSWNKDWLQFKYRNHSSTRNYWRKRHKCRDFRHNQANCSRRYNIKKSLSPNCTNAYRTCLNPHQKSPNCFRSNPHKSNTSNSNSPNRNY